MQVRPNESTDMTVARIVERLGQDMEYRRDFQRVSIWVLGLVIATFVALGGQSLYLMGQTAAMSRTLEEHSQRLVSIRQEQETRSTRIEISMRDIQTDVKELLQRTADNEPRGRK